MEKYRYSAYVVKAYDGDTCTVNIDFGMNLMQSNKKLRLWGIDTPEMRGEEREQGKIAKQFVHDRILGKKILLNTKKDKTGKYGRLLGVVYYENDKSEMINLNEELVNKGLAEEYMKT